MNQTKMYKYNSRFSLRVPNSIEARWIQAAL